jgi:hypothetical protein
MEHMAGYNRPYVPSVRFFFDLVSQARPVMTLFATGVVSVGAARVRATRPGAI